MRDLMCNKTAVVFGELRNSSNTHTHTKPRAKFRQLFLTIKELRRPDNSKKSNKIELHSRYLEGCRLYVFSLLCKNGREIGHLNINH